MASITIKNFLGIRVGSMFQDIYFREYDLEKRFYDTQLTSVGYVMAPFLRVKLYLGEKTELAYFMRRYIDTIADDYWDFSLNINAGF